MGLEVGSAEKPASRPPFAASPLSGQGGSLQPRRRSLERCRNKRSKQKTKTKTRKSESYSLTSRDLRLTFGVHFTGLVRWSNSGRSTSFVIYSLKLPQFEVKSF